MLKKKWRYSIVIAILAPILLIIMFTATQVLGRTEALVKTLNHTAQLILQEKITSVLDVLTAISKLPVVSNSELSLQERAESLHLFQEQYDFARLTLADAEGNVESALFGETTNISDYQFFRKRKRQSER